LAFLTRKKAKLCQNLIITLVFEKNAIFFSENCQKSQKIMKIVIIPSTPGHPARFPVFQDYQVDLYLRQHWEDPRLNDPAITEALVRE
jgi:hypothetical protein